MIEGGALEGVNAIFGLHVWMELPSGVVGIREGPFMAGVGRFDVEILGKGGHGASPHETIDPIPIAAQAVLAFQTIISRNLNPLESGVVSVGSIKAGEAFNVIPERVYMSGTYRFFTPETKSLVEKRIEEILKGITLANNASYKLKIEEVGPPTINNPQMASLAKRVAQNLELKVEEVPKTMGAEDFAFYLQKVPGAFIALGIRNEEKGIVYPHHHPKFDVDEDVLHLGTALEVGLAFERI